MTKQNERGPVQAHYDVTRTAALLDVSPRWVKQQIAKGNLVASRIGKKIVVQADSIKDLLNRTTISPKQAEPNEAIAN